MSRQEIYYAYSLDDLFGNGYTELGPSLPWADVDCKASSRLYDQLLLRALQKRFPEAEVRVAAKQSHQRWAAGFGKQENFHTMRICEEIAAELADNGAWTLNHQGEPTE